MYNMKNGILFVFFFSGAFVSGATLDNFLELVGKKQALLGKSQLTKNVEAKGKEKKHYSMAFDLNRIKYELEISKPITKESFTRNRKNISTIILNSYRDQPTPYSGVVTNMAKCENKFLPETSQIKIGEKEVFILKSFVGKNFNYGICDDKQVAYTACTAFHYEEKIQQEYKLKVFVNSKADCKDQVSAFFENLVSL